MTEANSAAATVAPDDGLIRIETIAFDQSRHRADLERLVVRGGIVAMNLLIVTTFIVLMWGPVSARTALAPVMGVLVGLVLGVLGCVFNPFKGRHRGE